MNRSCIPSNENPTPGQPHNHDLSDISKRLTYSRYAMKEEVALTRDKPSHIFAQVISTFYYDVEAMMPREEICKSNMRYQRLAPPVPPELCRCHKPAECTITTNKQQFILYDNEQNVENSLLVFCIPDSLQLLLKLHVTSGRRGRDFFCSNKKSKKTRFQCAFCDSFVK
ncbi:Hypothetical predicted protein [Mytilus galloprovincialis]|uniref:Uncharacterized protein n=1 Tax=Mytilus galloprovincialis TaxID=29158 RepID=A0A8B6DYL1_MYTGA|nr:Hypothetical predicted protein [Mytilus galloprovincialis]